MRIGSAVRAVLATGFGLSLLLCLALFYEFYWRWRDCFDDRGRCFDEVEVVVHHAEAGEVFGLFAALSALGLTASLYLPQR